MKSRLPVDVMIIRKWWKACSIKMMSAERMRSLFRLVDSAPELSPTPCAALMLNLDVLLELVQLWEKKPRFTAWIFHLFCFQRRQEARLWQKAGGSVRLWRWRARNVTLCTNCGCRMGASVHVWSDRMPAFYKIAWSVDWVQLSLLGNFMHNYTEK